MKGRDDAAAASADKKEVSPKKKRKNHSQLGKDFVAPDGGFGWFICVAAGFSNLSTFPVLQQFGLLFRERLTSLQISSSQITTIININQAATSLIGLANGPVFRRFSFRQVALFGATLVSIAIFFTSSANSFMTFLISFSILYGAGVGLTTSSNSLALNTYFKERRRIVMGISWSCTALGPIIFPHIVTFLIPHYGVFGTILLFCGLAMNAICCALLLQPVLWHVKKTPRAFIERQMSEQLLSEIECLYCQSRKEKRAQKGGSLFSSQYLFSADDPATPMLAREGWYTPTSRSPTKRSVYSSKMSLASKRIGEYDSKKASNQNLSAASKRPSFARVKDLRMSQKIVEINQENKHYKSQPATPMASRNSIVLPQISENKYMTDNHSVRSYRQQQSFRGRVGTETDVLSLAKSKLEEYVNAGDEEALRCTCEEVKQQYLLSHIRNKPLVEEEHEDGEAEEIDEGAGVKLSLWQKIIIFFDLDLLKDWSYLNIMIGITLANFAELNFSILTPFVLNEFGLDASQIAMCMSILGIADICCRFFIPFVANYTRFENRTFFLIGVVNMAFGRIVLAHFHSFHISLAIAVWIGFNKGLRTVFMALCIPSHVHIDRLPAATGLHLLFSGLFYIFMGPIVGFVRDHSNYVITLHCLNVTTFTCAISWTIEKIILNRRERKRMKMMRGDEENIELQ